MQFCVYSRKYLDVAAAYGQQLAPYRDSWHRTATAGPVWKSGR